MLEGPVRSVLPNHPEERVCNFEVGTHTPTKPRFQCVKSFILSRIKAFIFVDTHVRKSFGSAQTLPQNRLVLVVAISVLNRRRRLDQE